MAGRLAPRTQTWRESSERTPPALKFPVLTNEVAERDIEQALTDLGVKTVPELGARFAFAGRHDRFKVDVFVHLLLFHTEQFRYVAIDLKAG